MSQMGCYNPEFTYRRVVWAEESDQTAHYDRSQSNADQIWNAANARCFSTCAFNSLEIEWQEIDVSGEHQLIVNDRLNVDPVTYVYRAIAKNADNRAQAPTVLCLHKILGGIVARSPR